jgi:predicted ABC-type transport system involved in lysophospholipase L1 biosynthesis ATPase subunit
MIQLKSITKSYPMGKRELLVLRGVDLQILKGQMVAIMGLQVPARAHCLIWLDSWTGLLQAAISWIVKRSAVLAVENWPKSGGKR